MKDEIDYAVETYKGGKRVMVVRRKSGAEEVREVPDGKRPLFMTMNVAGDVDDIALRDMSQEAQECPPPEREDKPDIPKLYDELRENRAIEASGRRHYGMWPRKKGNR